MKRMVAISVAVAILATALSTFAAPTPTFAQQSAPPGLYVTNLRVQPGSPAFSQSVSFYPTFLSTVQGDYAVKWLVYIWKADEAWKTNNETSVQLTHFPTGSAEYTALGSFKYGGTGRVCEYFYARVAWLDNNNLPVYFTDPSGKVVEQGFSVCDASVIPTAVPATVAPATPIAKPPPGLFVTDLRLSPDRPAFNNLINFYPTFSNTTDQLMTFNWKVYIWKSGDPGHTDNETSLVQTGFPSGSAEYSALGNYKYGATGNTCENFTARVGWLDINNSANYFMYPDGRVFEKAFSVCDVLTIPTSAPPTSAPPTAIPTPAPGLFVTGLTLSPSDTPMHNQATSFNVSFSNTTAQMMTFNWRVYIYKLDNMAASNTETSIQSTGFASGAGNYAALGTFKYGSTGYSCDAFTARVGWLDNNNQTHFFMMPDGRMFERPFSVCN